MLVYKRVSNTCERYQENHSEGFHPGYHEVIDFGSLKAGHFTLFRGEDGNMYKEVEYEIKIGNHVINTVEVIDG